MLILDEYMNYINDPFNNTTTVTYLKNTSPRQNVSGPKSEQIYPPYGITYESLTYNVGRLDNGQRNLDVRHYNAYPIVPRLVYHLSTKLKNNAIHNWIVKKEEVHLIQFLTRYGYATRAAPFCKIHGAYGKYTNMQKIECVNNCEGLNRIIPVTVFLVMLFNACFLYQPKTDTHLLIAALNGFDYGMTLSDDTFMNTLSKFFHFDKLFKL